MAFHNPPLFKIQTCPDFWSPLYFLNISVMAIACDIRHPEAIAQALDKIESEWELPSVVVNNAAGNFISPTERLSANAFKTVVDIVLNGTAFLTLEAGKRMIKQKKGEDKLINWTSDLPGIQMAKSFRIVKCMASEYRT